MSLEGLLDALDAAIFADTGWEPPGVYEHLDKLVRYCGEDTPIYQVSRGNLRQDVLDSRNSERVGRIGQPPFYVKNLEGDGTDQGGMLWRKCTREYKIEPIEKKIREMLGVRPGKRAPKGTVATQVMGISLDEAHRMRDSRRPWIRLEYPLVDNRIRRSECLEWLQERGWLVPKSACVGCPYHTNRAWKVMKELRPEEFADAVDFDRKIRHGIPGTTGECYLHRRMTPLEDAVITDQDVGQASLFSADFAAECEGVCGV
jgi:hypothetical protein